MVEAVDSVSAWFILEIISLAYTNEISLLGTFTLHKKLPSFWGIISAFFR